MLLVDCFSAIRVWMVRRGNDVAMSKAVIRVRIFILSGSEGGPGIEGWRRAGAGALSKLVRLTVILFGCFKTCD